MAEIFIVSTSHISLESKKRILKAVEGFSPDLICLELDKQRFFSLLNSKNSKKVGYASPFKVGFAGFLFSLVGSFLQKHLGGKLNVVPGIDMLSAYEIANEKKIGIALIDQDIYRTLRNFSTKVTFWEKSKIFFGLLFGLLLLPFSFLFSSRKNRIDISKIPSSKQVSKIIAQFKKHYPHSFRVLVEDRNKVMANKVLALSEKFEKMLLVVGAGHENGLKKDLKDVFSKSQKNINIHSF